MLIEMDEWVRRSYIFRHRFKYKHKDLSVEVYKKDGKWYVSLYEVLDDETLYYLDHRTFGCLQSALSYMYKNYNGLDGRH